MRHALLALLFLVAPATALAQPAPLPSAIVDGTTLPAHWARAPLLDLAREAARVDVAWERFGVLGRGATVCVVDSGIDLAHRDFRDAGDHTRVDWLLDLDAAPRGSEPDLEARFGGAVLRADELDAMLAAGDPTLPRDWHGHGTAVASAAAGDDAAPGVETPGPHAGVAPLARLVVVRALRRGVGGFADEDILRGARFCAAVGAPGRTVVLLSLGGHDGAHDGTSAIEQALDGLVAHGLPIVVAAGNDGGRAIHAGARIPEGQSARFVVTVPRPEGVTDAHVAVVLRGATQVLARAPGGASVAIAAHGERARVTTEHGTLALDATRDEVVDVVLSGDAAHPLSGGELALEVRGRARVDAWLVSSEVGDTFLSPAFSGPTALAGEEVTIPGTSERVVTVGASLSRPILLTDLGPLTLEEDDRHRAILSATGPSARGSLRPDLLAPGGWIVVARSADVDPSDPEALARGRVADWTRIAQPDGRLALAGTSLSAAIVAGAFALAAERAPLDPERDRAHLVASATRESDRLFDPARGFGALDAAAFLERRAHAADSVMDADGAASRAWATVGASDLSVAVLTLPATSVPDDGWVTLTRADGTVVRAPRIAGVVRAPVALGRAVPGDTVRFVAEDDEGAWRTTIDVPVRAGEPGDLSRAIGGGCNVVSRRAATTSWPIVLVMLAACARKRSRPR